MLVEIEAYVLPILNGILNRDIEGDDCVKENKDSEGM